MGEKKKKTKKKVKQGEKNGYDFVFFHNSLPHATLERQTAPSCWRTDLKTGVIYVFLATTMFPHKACHNIALSDLAVM